jgi:hypothetical protein
MQIPIFYGFGPGPDEPLMWWNISTGAFRLLHADERGSVLALSDGGRHGVGQQRL